MNIAASFDVNTACLVLPSACNVRQHDRDLLRRANLDESANSELATEVAIRDNRGLLKQAASRDVEGEPNELGVRPIQGGGREGGSARCKARLAGWRLVIPDLLGQ
jgi:hypothetical protein